MKILALNGPNLNLLGTREPEIYGTTTLQQLEEDLRQHATAHCEDLVLDFLQSNHEGVLMDALHQASGNYDAVIFNPAAYTHYSIALRDAIAAIDIPVIEVHLSNPDKREDFRQVNVIRDVCAAHFQGRGAQSYVDALDFAVQNINSDSSSA